MASSTLLLDEEGCITEQLEICLQHIFAKYCTPLQEVGDEVSTFKLFTPTSNSFLSEEGLQKWALETNGEPFSQETKDEIVESFDITDQGQLTFKGFLQLYQLQTESDEEETWKDLQKHGFDKTLKLASKK